MKNNIITAPPSKSFLHRALICSSLCDGKTFLSFDVKNMPHDNLITEKCLGALGCGFEIEKGGIRVIPKKLCGGEIQCGESGSTLRFLLPVIASIGLDCVFSCGERLIKRPLEDILSLLSSHGVCVKKKENKIAIHGKANGGELEISGEESSQFLSGLLMALPFMDEKASVKLKGSLCSSPYIGITTSVMESFGVKITENNGVYTSSGGYSSPKEFSVEGDYSSAAVFFALSAITGKEIYINGLNPDSAQGDRRILDIIRLFGGKINRGSSGISVWSARKLHGITLDISDIPDLAPAIAVLGMFSEGETILSGVDRLRGKESDRLSAITSFLSESGIEASYYDNTLTIYGGAPHGGEYDSFSDHRIEMAESVIIKALGEGKIKNPGHTEKSFRNFYEIIGNIAI